MAIKTTSQTIVISQSVTESAANTFTSQEVSLQLNPLANEVFLVTGLNLDPDAPDSVAGLSFEAFGHSWGRSTEHLFPFRLDTTGGDEAADAGVHQDGAVGDLGKGGVPVPLELVVGPDHLARGGIPGLPPILGFYQAGLSAVRVDGVAFLIVPHEDLAVLQCDDADLVGGVGGVFVDEGMFKIFWTNHNFTLLVDIIVKLSFLTYMIYAEFHSR